MKMRKIAVVGFKGGIGKTTTCISIGAGLALQGHRVLMIDTDTQANMAFALGIQGYKLSLADVLLKKAEAVDVILQARKNLYLLPSSLSLFKAQQRMVMEIGREEIFSRIFSELNGYDYQLIDCSPSLSLLTVNSLAYVDEVFMPVSMEMLALASVEQFMGYLNNINKTLGRNVATRLIIPTFYDPRRKVSKQVIQYLKKFDAKVTDPIPVDTKLSEAPGVGKTIFEYAPRSRGSLAYARLVEFVAKMRPVSGDKIT